MFRLFVLIILCSPLGIWSQAIDTLIIKQVDSLIKVSRELSTRNDFDGALTVNRAAEKLALEKLGRGSAGYGSCCLNRGRLNYLKKDYGEAEKWILEAITVQGNALGKEHPLYATCLNTLATLYNNMGKFDKVEPLLLEIRAIREKVLGREHPDYAKSISNLALFYKDRGNFEKAEPLYLEAKDRQEKSLGKKNPDYAKCLAGLAELYKNRGMYEKSEPLYVESKVIREQVLGKEHPDYASILNSLGILYYYMGKYEKAEPLYVEANSINEKLFGKESLKYTHTSNNLAGLYANMGNYEKAEPLYLEVKAIQEKVFGRENPEYAGCLQNLGDLYRNMGNYEKAEPFFLEAKSINEKLLGKEHPNYALSLQNLGNLYSDMGDYKKAEPFYLETKTIQEKVLGKEHPDYAGCLQNLGSLYVYMGDYKKAESFYLETKTIQEKVLGKEHPDYAGCLQNLGELYMIMGDYQKAEPLFVEAITIRVKVLGKEHPYNTVCLQYLAKLHRDIGKFEKAESNFQELAQLNQSLLEKGVRHLSERELGSYLNQFSNDQDLIFSFVQQSGRNSLTTSCYNNTLFYKGFLLQASTQLKFLANTDTAAAEKFNLLKSYERRLAVLYSQPIAERDSNAVASLEAVANDLEKDLARIVAGYGNASRQVKWQEVMSALKGGEAAIEFVSFKSDDPKGTESVMYGALMLKPGIDHPQFIPLFEEKSLDSLLHSKSERKEDYVINLYTLADRGATALEAPKKSLYKILWKPLEKELVGIKTIYFSPSGLLHRINLDAIPVSETETLADRYQLIELNSTRQIVLPEQIKNVNNDAILFGGIQFEQDTTLHNDEPLIASRSRGELTFSSVDSTLRGGSWNYLSGTEREVSSIEKIVQASGMNVRIKKGFEAKEESFKKIGANHNPSPRILHIATHGYFFPDPKEKASNQQLAISNGQNESVFKISDHPLLRSGLIMAGGNAAWQGKQTLEGSEDGILTAYEISQMNLSNTELVVLSACETGLGDIQGNEGVYGLQRAFKIAGAKYLIMSLWQVPDKQTSLLMTTFYKKWLEAEGPDKGGNKMAIPDAFHAAQKELRDLGLDPYQWAGFVLVE